MKLRLLNQELTLARRGAEVELEGPGEPARYACRTLPDGRIEVRRGEHCWRFVVADGAVHHLGSVIRPELVGAPRASSPPADSAPLPSTLVAVRVRVGQRVAAGDVLAVVSAMKTEIHLCAPYDAHVVAILATPGSALAAGTAPIRLERLT